MHLSTKKRAGLVIASVVMLAIIITYGVIRKNGKQANLNAPDSSEEKANSAKKKSKKKGKKDSTKEEDPVPVEVRKVCLRDISSYYHTTASIEAEKKVDVVAKITGEISQILVEEGDRVKKGQLLCKLDDEEQRIELEEAGINKKKEEEEYKRIKRMYDQNLVSDKEYSDIRFKFEIAGNRLDAAHLKYDYTKVKAPFKGVITKRYINVGENVSLGMKLFELADVEPLLITMYLPENEMKHIEVKQMVYISPDSDPSKVIQGEIIRCAPEVDDKTGTVKITAQVHGQVMPGSFVRVRIVKSTHGNSLAVPSRSLIDDAGEVFVYVAHADTVSKTKIDIGFQDDKYTEVVAGLEQDDSVVVVGQGGLKTGTRIKILTLSSTKDSVSVDFGRK